MGLARVTTTPGNQYAGACVPAEIECCPIDARISGSHQLINVALTNQSLGSPLARQSTQVKHQQLGINRPYKQHVDEVCGEADEAWRDPAARDGYVLRSRPRSHSERPWPSASRAAPLTGQV